MNNLNNIRDYLKVFNNIDKKPEPRFMAQGGRLGYKPGGIVEPGVTHYAQKDPYPKKKGFVWDLDKKEFRKPKKRTGRPVTSPFVSEASNIVQAYKDYVIDAFNKGDMSATKPFNGWINSEYPEKSGSVKDAVYKQKLQPEKFEIQKKKELIKKLISEANAGEKFVEIQAISKKISNRKSFKDIEWVNKKDIVDYEGNSLQTREQKVSKVFDNIRNEDSLLSLSKKPAAGLKHNGIFTQLIGERSGVNTAWVIRRGLDQNAWYKDNVKSMKYLRGYHAEDFIDMPFSEAFEFADERVGHRVNYKGRSKLRMFKDPNHNIMGWALRHWDGNNFAGKKTLKQGNRIQFFDKKGNPIAWEKDLKLNMGDVSFTYDGKPMEWNLKTLKTKGPKSGLFNEAYDATKNYFTTMNKEVLYKGKTMPFGDLMKKIYGDRPISIGHEGIGGVRGEPFKKFKIMTQSMNSALGSVMKSIPQKSLRKKMITEIFGDLKSLKGQAWTDAMVNLEVKKAGQTIKGGLTPYVQAAKNIFEREGPKLPKPAVQKLTQILKRGDPLHTELMKYCPRGKQLAKAGGGRIGFSGNCSIDEAATGLKNELSKVKNPAQLGKFGKIGRLAGGFVGWVDAPLEILFALPGILKGDMNEALSNTTLGLFGAGETEMEQLKPGTALYNVAKNNKDVQDYTKNLFQAQALEAHTTKLEGMLKKYPNDPAIENDLAQTNLQKQKIIDDTKTIIKDFRPVALDERTQASKELSAQEIASAQEGIFTSYGKPKDLSNIKDYIENKGDPYYGATRVAAEKLPISASFGDIKGYDKFDDYIRDSYVDLPVKLASQYGKFEKQETDELARLKKEKELLRYSAIPFAEYGPSIIRGAPKFLGFNQGGRVPFGKGKLAIEGIDKGRRAFMKWLAGITGAGVAAGTGILKLGTKAAPKVIKEAEVITRGADGMPKYIYDLIEVVKAKGAKDIVEGLKKSDYSAVHSYKGVDVIEDGAGNIKIKSDRGGVATDPYTGKTHEGIAQEHHMQIEKGEYVRSADEAAEGTIKTPDEYIEGTVRPDMDGKMKDFEEGLDEDVHKFFKKIADEIDDGYMTGYTKIKPGKASGGRVSYFDGGIVSLKKKW